jgi:hypothetical protein
MTPNAPSEPVWGFGSDRAAAVEEKAAEPIGEVYYRREEVGEAEAPTVEPERKPEAQRFVSAARDSETLPGPEPESETAAPAEPEKPQSARRGWWQRTFR